MRAFRWGGWPGGMPADPNCECDTFEIYALPKSSTNGPTPPTCRTFGDSSLTQNVSHLQGALLS